MDFEGPSPDEIALLRGTRDYCNLYLKGQNSNLVILSNGVETLKIEKLFVFKFDSTRKMMSVIIRFQDKLFLLTKGADNAIAEKSINGTTEDLPAYFSECVDFYLETGLRVMFMGIKLISENEFSQFIKEV